MIRRFLFSAVVAGLCALSTGVALASGFSALISPPRFEVAVKPGVVFRDAVAITNASKAATKLFIKTADWTLDPSGTPVFSEALAADSCRPWTRIERNSISIGPSGTYRFRFEIQPPEGTAPRECRFALLIEGEPEEVKAGLSLPVAGRIGVIVYASVGAIEPNLKVIAYGTKVQEGRNLPTITVQNSGTGHGRLEGYLEGLDASGHKGVFSPASLPILPGESRVLVLNQEDETGKTLPQVAYPVTIKGRLDWGDKRLEIDQTFQP